MLAALIRQQNKHDVEICDLYLKNYQYYVKDFADNNAGILESPKSSLMKAIMLVKPDIVGFSALFNFQHGLVKCLAQYVKEYNSHIQTYVGGYSTIAPELVLQDIPWLDIAFIGESEISFPKSS